MVFTHAGHRASEKFAVDGIKDESQHDRPPLPNGSNWYREFVSGRFRGLVKWFRRDPRWSVDLARAPAPIGQESATGIHLLSRQSVTAD
jgi:hypothetical protein